jgi:hypothetical protein
MSRIAILFTGIFISINDTPVTIDYLKSKLTLTTYNDPQDKGGVNYNLSFLDNFLKIEYNYGRSLPRPDNVINVNTHLPEVNPRNSDQYEPKQHFALLDCTTGYLWLSNSRKQTLIIDFLKRNLNEPKVYAKSVYNEESFLNSIKVLDELRFSVVPNLFSATNTLTDALAEEINGYGGSIATLSIKFEEAIPITKIFSKIANALRNKTSFRNIVISGRDERNLGMLLNADLFSRKIEIRTEVDDNENYNIEDVFNALISKINNENS